MTSRKDDIKYHEKLKQASIYVYHGGNAQLPLGYRVIDKAENTENGFYAEAYSNGKDIIIAYRGTDDWQDRMVDFDMVRSQLPGRRLGGALGSDGEPAPPRDPDPRPRRPD